jgi:hypothetical protein
MLRRHFSLRSLRTFTSLLTSLVLATGVLTAGLLLATASSASAAPKAPAVQVTLCLTNSSSYCADVKDSDNVSGQPIWLYQSGNDDHWIMISGVTCTAGSNCFKFEDAQNTSLCLSTTVGRAIELGTCGDRGSWYSEGGNLLGNGAYAASYTLMVQSPANKNLLTALPANTSGYWQQWSY